MQKYSWKLILFCALLFGSLTPGCQAFSAPSSSARKAAPPAKQQKLALRRWYTVDASSPVEMKQKEEYLARIDRFWYQFKKDQAKLKVFKPKDGHFDFQTRWAQTYIKQVHPELYYEFGPGDKDGEKKLDFSVVGDHHLIPIAKTLAAKAPKIPGWSFNAYKRPTKFTAIEEMFKARGFHRTTPQFRGEFSVSSSNLLNVIVAFPTATGDYSKDAEIVLLLCDMILGEENSDIWIGELNAQRSKVQKKFDYVQSSKDFANAFYAKKKELLAGLPKVPYFKMKEFGASGMFEFKTEGGRFSRRQTMSTTAAKLCNALVDEGRFHSATFSKFGEQFAYLQIPGAGIYVQPVVRGKLEDALDSELRNAQVGCVFAAGFGKPDISYIDLCLIDVNTAIPLIKKVCAKFNLSHQSNLRFYDCDWLYEWVRMFDDTPVPTDLDRPWFYHPE